MDNTLRNKAMFGKIEKRWLHSHLLSMVEECESRVIEQNEHAGYQLGHHFGTMDTLRAVINLLDGLPEKDPNEPEAQADRRWRLERLRRGL